MDDIPTPELEEETSLTSQEADKTEEKPIKRSFKPPIPVKDKKPISLRPPAPRPLPITPREKKTKEISKSKESIKSKTEKPSSKAKAYSVPSISSKTVMKGHDKEQDSKLKTRPIQSIREEIIQQSQKVTPLLQYFDDISSPILNRKTGEGWPWAHSKKVFVPPKLVTQWKTEASLFSAIGSLEFFHQQQSNGDISPETYHRQLKSLLIEALQLLIRLEKSDAFNFEQFIKKENVTKYFPQGLEKLRLAEGSSDLDSLIDGQKLNYQELVKLPTKAADYVANGIELMDLIRLKQIATVDRILPLLDEMRGILLSMKDIFEEDYWAVKEINVWRKKLDKESPGSILPENDLEKLEMQAIRWMNDFRRELKNI